MKPTKKQLQKQTQNELENREEKKHELVAQTHKRNKQTGVYESINDIFTRLPLPRIQKSAYKFLFENVKENVENVLEQENQIQEMQKIQQMEIDNIEANFGKMPKFTNEEDDVFKQKLPSNNALFKSIVYMRNQKKQFQFTKLEGNIQPFLADSFFIDLEKIKKQIPNLKLLLQDGIPLKRHTFEFMNQNQIVFKDQSFPSTLEIDQRAQVLAKLYIFELYREQNRKLMIMDRNEQAELQRKRQMNKIKQNMELEKMKEGELIDDNDLLKQVYKILEWIEKKMNGLAYEEFKNKNGDRATQLKKSLQKLKNNVNAEIVTMNKLKMLISYKYKKGW